MTISIELQVIAKLLDSKTSAEEINRLLEFDSSYYSVFHEHIQYIIDHFEEYGHVPDPFTFLSEFEDVELIEVNEPIDYLTDELKKNKQHILLIDTFNTLKDLGSSDVSDAWEYLTLQCEKANNLETSDPVDLVQDGEERANTIIEFNQKQRIPTGFAEIDKIMYGGLSTVEELLVLVARTNTGKSWVGTRMMETAQSKGFNVLYYSPEMQSAFLGTRFDTWRTHIPNSQLHQGNYSEAYYKYLKDLKTMPGHAFVLEDKDAPDNEVTVPFIRTLVKKHEIKLVIIDGLSYMTDARGKRGDTDSTKYKNLCSDLFRMSKQCGCAVVVMMQANRESRDNKDEKGEVFPNIYNIEGSDHPARIATQVFAMRQLFDKHILDIRLEKSRSANNVKPTFSYAWDINTGNVSYVPDPSANIGTGSVTPSVTPPIVKSNTDITDDLSGLYDDDDDSNEDVNF